MNEVAKITEEAGKHANDTNWLAVVLLFLTLFALVWLFRWIVGELRQLFREANDGRTECAKIIATNTTVIQECRDTICDATEFMKRKVIIILSFGLLMFSGCASMSPEQKARVQSRVQTGATLAAYVGTVETLRARPEYRVGFELAVDQLRLLETGPMDTIKLLEIVNRLPVKELKSDRAQMIISAATIVLNDEIGSTPLEKLNDLKPIVTAIREGIERGLSQ